MTAFSDQLPCCCFISHSYRDEKALSVLLSSLSPVVQPYIFPPITVSPEQFVSTSLIDAILSQEGLIYLVGGYSAESFWVSFERDYGLRSKRKVFSFESKGSKLSPDRRDPRMISVYTSYTRREGDHVRAITEDMASQRHFNVWVDSSVTADIETSLRRSIKSVLDQGGYAVLFWSREAARSSFITKEMEWVWTLKKGRILAAMLEDVPPPSWLGDNLPPCLEPVNFSAMTFDLR